MAEQGLVSHLAFVAITRLDTMLSFRCSLSSTHFAPSVRKGTHQPGLGGSLGLLSRGETSQWSQGRQGEEAGLFISRESFNLDIRENLLTAKLVRHENRLSGVAVKFPKMCLRPCEANVGLRWLE